MCLYAFKILGRLSSQLMYTVYYSGMQDQFYNIPQAKYDMRYDSGSNIIIHIQLFINSQHFGILLDKLARALSDLR